VSVVESVESFVAGLSGEAADDPLAASALALAAEIDDAGNSATSKSMVAKELRETLAYLRAMSPAKKEADDVDEIAAAREKRRAAARSATAADL
jgi:hypothetical protein